MLKVVIPSATHHIQAGFSTLGGNSISHYGNSICHKKKNSRQQHLPNNPMAYQCINSGTNICHKYSCMAITSAITYGNNICHYTLWAKICHSIQNILPNVVANTSATIFMHNISLIVIWLNICHN